MADEDLKLFGEVGIGYEQLQKDGEAINKVFDDMDKKAKNFGKTMEELSKNKNAIPKFEGQQKKFNKEIESFNNFSGRLAKEIAKNINNIDSFYEKAEKISNKSINKQQQKHETSIANMKKYCNELKELNNSWIKNQDGATDKRFEVVELKNAINVIRSYRDELGALNREVIRYKTDNKGYKELSNQSKYKVDKPYFKIEEISKARKELLDAQRLIAKNDDTISYKVNDKANNIVETVRKYKNNLGEVVTEQKKYMMSADGFVLANEKITNSFAKQQQVTKNFKNELVERGNSMAKTAIVGAVAGGSIVAMKDIYDINKDFQSQQTDIQRITNFNKKEMSDLKRMSFEVGKETATQIENIQQMENLWIRTGHSKLEDLKELTRVTAIGMNVAKFESAGKAVQYLNATINQIANGDVSKAQEIMDSWSKMADTTAIQSATDLAEIVSRAGGQANQLKMDIHEINAVSAIAQEHMAMSGDVLGTQLKSMFSRIQQKKVVDNLKKFGVEVVKQTKDGAREFRTFEEIMTQVNAKYNELMSQKRELEASQMMEQIGGTRQRALAINLTKHWDKFAPYVENSKDSVGFAEEQNKKKLKNLAEQLKITKVAFQEFAVAIGEAGLIPLLTSIAKAGTTALNVFNNLPETTKKIITQTLALAGAYKLLKHSIGKKDGFDTLKGLMGIGEQGEKIKFAENFINESKKLKLSAGEMKGAIGQVSTAVGTTLQAGMNAGAKSMSSLKATLTGLIAGFQNLIPLLGLVGVAVGVGYAGYKMYQKNKEKQETVTKVANGKINEEAKLRESSYNNFIKEKENFDKTNTNKDKITYNEEFAKSIEEVGKALGIESNYALDSTASLEKYVNVVKNKMLVERIADEKKKSQAEKTARQRETADLEGLTIAYSNLLDAKDKFDNAKTEKQITKSKEGLSKVIEEYNKYRQKVEEDEAILGKKIIDRTIHKDNLDGLLKELDLTKLFNENINGENVSNEINKVTSSLEDLKGQFDFSDVEDINDILKNEDFKNLCDSINNVTAKTKDLRGALEEYANTGTISLDTVSGLIQKYPELSKYIEKVGDSYAFTNGAIEKFEELNKDKQDEIDNLLGSTKDLEHHSLMDNDSTLSFNFDDAKQQVEDLKTSLSSLSEQEISTYGLDSFMQKIDDLETRLSEGSINFGEFMNEIDSAISDIDISKITDSEDLSVVYDTVTNNILNTMEKLAELKDQNKITLDQYSQGVNECLGQLQGFLGQVSTLANSSDENLRRIGESALQSVNEINNVGSSLVDLNGIIAMFSDYGSIIGGMFDDIGNSARTNAEDAGLSWSNFQAEFTNAMKEIKESDVGLFNDIAESISEATGIALEDVKEQLVDIESPLLESASSFGGAITGIVNQYSSSIGSLKSMVDKNVGQMANSLKNFKGEVTGTAKKAGETKFSATFDTAGMTGEKPRFEMRIPNFKYDIKSNINGGSSGGGSSSSGGGIFSSVGSAVSSAFSSVGSAVKNVFKGAKDGFNYQRKNNNNNSVSNRSNKQANTEDVKKALQSLGNDNKKKKRGKGGGGSPRKGKGGGGKGKKGRKDQIPEQLQKLIDELEHQVSVGELDDFGMAQKLNKAVKDYKGQLSDKVAKQMREKIFNLRTGGSGTRFSEEVKEIKETMSYLDSEIALLSKEEELSKALNDGKNEKLSNEINKTNILKEKMNSHQELVKKYEGLLNKINTEIGSLDKNTKSYITDLNDLTRAKQNVIMKLNQEKIALMDNSKAQIEAIKTIQRAKQESYNQASDKMAKIQSSIVEFINQRNNAIKESVNETFNQQMKALDEQAKKEDEHFKNKKEKYQHELDAFKEMVQGKIDALNRQYHEEDYKKDLNKEVEELNKIQKEIDNRRLDDTYSSKSKIIKLEEDLKKKREHISDMQRQHERDGVIRGLQDQLDEHNKANKEKLDLMDKEFERFRKGKDEEKELLQESHEREMKSLEERAKARYVYTEARKSILSGYVQDVNGAMISIEDAMIQVAEESGDAFGIFAERTRSEISELAGEVQNLLQMIGHANNMANNVLQKSLGLTNNGYRDFLVGNRFGMTGQDFEVYMSNKLKYGSASKEEQARLNKINADLRKKYHIDKDNFSFSDLRKDSYGYDHIGSLSGSSIRGLSKKDADDWVNAKLNWMEAKTDIEKNRWANVGKNIRKKNNIPDNADVSINDIFNSDFSKYTGKNNSFTLPDIPNISVPSTYNTNNRTSHSNNYNNSKYNINSVVNISGYDDATGILEKHGVKMSKDVSDNLREILERSGIGR